MHLLDNNPVPRFGKGDASRLPTFPEEMASVRLVIPAVRKLETLMRGLEVPIPTLCDSEARDEVPMGLQYL